jgi:hypothetical protein
MSDVRTLIALAEKMSPASENDAPPAGYQDDERVDVNASWRIGSVEEADWAFEKMEQNEDLIRSIDVQLEAAITRATKKAEQLKRSPTLAIAFFKANLEEFGTREKRTLLNGSKKKSRAFLHGVIGWKVKHKGGVLRWLDEALTLDWAKSRPVEQGLYRVKYELDKKTIQDVARTENIIPPGCELELETDEIYVKTTGEG